MSNHPHTQPRSAGTLGSFSVVLAYRDNAHARLGTTFCEGLLRYLGCARNVAISEWNFGMLATPALRVIAASEAEQARFVVVATDSGDALPEDVKAWFERWCSCRPLEQGTIVVLLSAHSGSADALWPDYGYVQDKANGCGRHFIVYASGWHPEDDAFFCLADARRVTSTGLIAVEGSHEVTEFSRPGDSQ
jgi:hypothetical protein